LLRIHFSGDDLARTRLAGGPDPMWETLLSLHVLQQPEDVGPLRQWRNTVRKQVPPSTALLHELAPYRGYSADFLTPAGVGDEGFEAGLEAVLATPRHRLRGDIAVLMAERRPTPWLRSLAEGRSTSLERLGHALRDYHSCAIAPFWRELCHQAAFDRAARAHMLVEYGLGRLLGTLLPAMRWQGRTLTVPYGGYDRDVYLDGRGLLVVPSMFCRGRPVCLRDPGLPPVLVYPIAPALSRLGPAENAMAGRDDDLHVATPARRGPAGVVRQLTRREQQVLALMAEGRSNEAITQRLGVSDKTVETHVRNIFAKLKLKPDLADHRRVLAVLAYLHSGLLPAPARPHPGRGEAGGEGVLELLTE
jgi:DNA-binding CsgD family transcriptional regulator